MSAVGRELWMDRLRGVAVLLVLVWHVVSIPTFFGLGMPGSIQWANDALSPYRIPTLLFLSGLLLKKSLQKSAGRYYWGKIAHVAWPLLVWSAIYLLANPGVDGSTIWYWLGGSYLWYLVVIGFCYIIGPVIRWVPPLIVAAAAVTVLLLANPQNGLAVQLLEHLPYFFIGVAAIPIMNGVLRLPGWTISLAGLGALAWAAYSATALGYAPRIHPLGTVASLLGIACLAWLLNRARRARGLEWLGQHSLELYVAHFPLMVIACRMGAVDLPVPLTYSILAAVGIGGSIVLARFFSRTPLFRLPTSKGRQPGRPGPTGNVGGRPERSVSGSGDEGLTGTG